MKSKKTPHLLSMNGTSSFIASLVITGAPAFAATSVWDGGVAGTGTDIGVGTNWSPDGLPSAATPDTAQWNGSVAGTLALLYNDASLAGAIGNAGINLDLTAAQTGAVSIDSGSNTGVLRINNITIAADAGAFTLGNGFDTFNLTLGGGTSTQTFTNNSVNTATISSDAILALGGGGNHLLHFTGAGNWSVSSNLAFTAGGLGSIYKTGAGTLTLSGGGAFKEGATVNGGAIFSAVFKEGSTIINGGTYTNNGANNGELVVGGLDTTGTNTSVTINNASILNGIDYLSIGRGNGTGTTTSSLTLNNTASLTTANTSLGYNGNNGTTAPKGSITLNNSAALTIGTNGAFNLGESAGSHMTITLNGSSTLNVNGNGSAVNRNIGNLGTGILTLNDTSTATFGNSLINVGYQNGSGTLNVNTGTTFTVGAEIRVAASNVNGTYTGNGTINVSGGTLNANALTLCRNNDNVASTYTAAINLTSGTVNVANGGTLIGWQGGSSTATLAISGGTFNQATTATAQMEIGVFGNVAGAVTVSNTGTLNMQRNSNIRFSTNALSSGTNSFTLSGGNVNFYSDAGTTVGGTGAVDLMFAAATANNTFHLNGGTLTTNQVITTNNAATATFNFGGGTLKAASNNANFLDLGGATQTAKVLAGGAKIDTNGKDVTIPQALLSGVSSDGGLTKSGTGTLTLSSGSSSYTGPTLVSAGTLNVPNIFFTWGSGIQINGTGAKLTSGGTITVPVTLTAGSINAVGAIDNLTVANNATNNITAGNGTNGQLATQSLTFQGAASLTVQATGTSTDRYLTAVNLTTSAAGPITVHATNTTGIWTSGTDYTVIEYNGTFTGSQAHFVAGTIPDLNPNQTAQIVNTGSAIVIRITGESLVWTGTQSADWSTAAIGGAKNWSYQSNGIEFTANSPVIFNDNSTRTTVNLASNVNPSTVLFASNQNYTLSSTGNFGITSGILTKTGTGKLTIATNNTYTGATQLNEGTVEVTGSIGSSSTITVTPDATLILNPATSATYGSTLAGSGPIRKQGTGTLTLAGASTTTGNIHLEGGTLNLNSAGALGTGPGYFEITGGVLNNTSGGAVTMTGAKPQRWNADFTFTGTQDLALGTGAVTIGTANRTVNVVAGNLGSGGITNTSGDLIKTGAGALRLSGGVSTIHGKLDIQAGIVGMGEDIYADGLTGNGILENNTANTKWGYWHIITDQTTSTLIRDGAGAGHTGIAKRGTATWTLTNNSNFATGNLNAENGKLVLNNTGTYGAVGPAGAVITNLTSVVGSTGGSNGILEINGATVDYHNMNNADGAAFRASLSIATNGTGAGALRFTSGSLTTYRQLAIGSANGAYGAFTQSGGTTNVGGFLALGLGNSSGTFTQTGGTYNQTTFPITNGAGAGSTGVMRLSGNALFNVNGTGDNGLWLGEAGTGRLSIAGSAVLNFAATNTGLQLGRGAAGTGIANLLGGNVVTPAVTKGAGTGTLNFNGGTLTANAASGAFITGLTNAYIHAGGGTIANGGNAITIVQPLLAPTGNGVALGSLSPSGTGYIAAPVVQITGDGTGATAVAEVDASGTLTAITITNPGTGYTTPPTFTLVGGGIGNTGSIGGTASLVPNTSGALTFTGTATTILSGQNTYTGNSIVSSGTTLGLSTSGSLTFKPGANNVSNKVTGTGTASFDGSFTIDLTGAAIANGNKWTLVDVATRSYSAVSFTIPGFTQSSDVWTKVDGNNTWTFTEATGELALAVSAGGGFTSWIGGFGLAPADRDANDDPDGDGITNFIEYALGGNPSVREPALVPSGNKSGSNFVLSFTRSDLAVTNGDAPLSIEYGTTLGTWTTVAVPASGSTVSGVIFNVTPGSPTDAITATIPTGGASKFFARVKAGN